MNRKNFIDKQDHFFLWTYLHQACFVSNVLENQVDLNILNILGTTRVMSMNFCLVNTLTCQILIWVCKVLSLFQQIFLCKKVKGDIIKRQKTSSLKSEVQMKNNEYRKNTEKKTRKKISVWKHNIGFLNSLRNLFTILATFQNFVIITFSTRRPWMADDEHFSCAD